MNVCVIGAGYVGLVTSACLAFFGHSVVTVDIDKNKIKSLQSGKIPFFEPHLDQLVSSGIQSGLLEFSDSIDSAARHAELIFIAVGTPSLADGEPDMSQVTSVAHAIGAALDDQKKRIIINKSTVPVGSGNWVEMLVYDGRQAAHAIPARGSKLDACSFAVISNPEFLREGSAIHDSFYPDRIVVGTADDWAVKMLRELYEPIINQSFIPPAYAPRPPGLTTIPFIVTDIASAEMIKYSANAFLAMKISFINEIASICEKVGADIRQISRGIGLDQRIGDKFLNAGVGWGGSCFAKDLKALIQIAREYSAPTGLLEATISTNQRQRFSPIVKLQEELKIIKGRTIGLLGLAFKPNTDDLRDAPSITIAAQLLKMGARVTAFDPAAAEVCAKLHPDLKIIYCHSIEELATNGDALVLVTEWDEFLHADWKAIARLMRKPLLIDGRNFLPESILTDAGFVYKGIGC